MASKIADCAREGPPHFSGVVVVAWHGQVLLPLVSSLKGRHGHEYMPIPHNTEGLPGKLVRPTIDDYRLPRGFQRSIHDRLWCSACGIQIAIRLMNEEPF